MVRLLPDRNWRLVRQRLGQKRSQNLDHRLATLAWDRMSIRGPFEQVRLSAWLQAHDRLLWRGTNPRGWSLEAHRDDCADRVSTTPTSSAGASATRRATQTGGQFWTPIGGQFCAPIDTFDTRIYISSAPL